MAALWTEADRDRLARFLGDAGFRFPPEDLTDLLDQADDAYPALYRDDAALPLPRKRQQVVDIATALGLYQLLAQASRLNDYVIQESQERLSQIPAQIERALGLLLARPWVAAVLGPKESAVDFRQIKQAPLKLGTRTRPRVADEFAAG